VQEISASAEISRRRGVIQTSEQLNSAQGNAALCKELLEVA